MPVARLSTDAVACWVIKSRTPPQEILTGWERGDSRELTRCIHRTYRADLMAAGQRCLLWLSGKHQPGVQAIGELTGAVEAREPRTSDVLEVAVTMSLHLLVEPVPRSSWLSDHDLAAAEVVRMPAGSNPSYLGPERYTVLRTLISPRDLDRAGW